MPLQTLPSSNLERFVAGLGAPLRGAQLLLNTPRLWKWMVLPVLLNIALLVLVLYVGIGWADNLVGWLWDQPEAKVARVFWFITVWIAKAVLLVVSFFVFVLLGEIVASPFNDFLVDHVEEEAGFRRTRSSPGQTLQSR